MDDITATFSFFLVMVMFLIVLFYISWRSELPLKRGRLLIKRLENEEPVLYWNKDNKVIAVCTAGAFRDAKEEYFENLREGRISAFDRVVLKPVPTFTFAENNGVYRPVHAGLVEDFYEMNERLFEMLTGESEKSLRPGHYEEALDLLVREDERLFVPYSANPKDFPLTEQFRHYGSPSVEELRKAVGLPYKGDL